MTKVCPQDHLTAVPRPFVADLRHGALRLVLQLDPSNHLLDGHVQLWQSLQ